MDLVLLKYQLLATLQDQTTIQGKMAVLQEINGWIQQQAAILNQKLVDQFAEVIKESEDGSNAVPKDNQEGA